MEEAFALLGDETYVIERNVNCPKQFLIRLAGSAGYIDKKHPSVTRDILGYGTTLLEAARATLQTKVAEKEALRERLLRAHAA
jgi:hypothetical protein